MNAAERVLAAIEYRPVDRVPLEYHPSGRGLYEHGEPLRHLIKGIPGDFADYSDHPIPVPDPRDIDENGRYHRVSTDEWGVTWSYRLFALMGHPLKRPLDDYVRLPDYMLPPEPLDDPEIYAQFCQRVDAVKQYGFCKEGGISLFERLIGLRRFEDVLVDITEDSAAINKLTDKLVSHALHRIDRLLAAGVDAISFGDDFGTQENMILSPAVWRRFFKPRYRLLMEPIKKAGIKATFHSCGQIGPILPDLREIGVDAVWPQLAVYNLMDLADMCRDLELAVTIHIDRAGVMSRGCPDDVQRAVHMAAETFQVYNGGSWFYIEIDNDFSWTNIEALFTAIRIYR